MCILNMNYFSYYSYTSSFAKYYQNATQRLIPLGENYELGLSNLTHLYTPITKPTYMFYSHLGVGTHSQYSYSS